MSGKKPILALAQGIARIHASSSSSTENPATAGSAASKAAETMKSAGSYQQFFSEKYPGAEITSTQITIDPRVLTDDPKFLKQQEAEQSSSSSSSSSSSAASTISSSGYLQDVHVDPTGAVYSYPPSIALGHEGLKQQMSLGSRVLNLPNLTTDRPAKYSMTCSKSVHKVVFLFCSVALAIIIACIILVESSGAYD